MTCLPCQTSQGLNPAVSFGTPVLVWELIILEQIQAHPFYEAKVGSGNQLHDGGKDPESNGVKEFNLSWLSILSHRPH